MSMDEVYERARVLERELHEFNGRLRASFGEVLRSHGEVSPLWNDAMRQEYDRSWKGAEEKMEEYLQRIGPQYVEFLIERLRFLQNYLHGHGS